MSDNRQYVNYLDNQRKQEITTNCTIMGLRKIRYLQPEISQNAKSR
jgi:hypothetical protein